MQGYSVTDVNPAWVKPEDMGSKKKFWYRQADDGKVDWLFKYPPRQLR